MLARIAILVIGMLAAIATTGCSRSTAGNGTQMVRLAKLVIDPAQVEAYKAALQEEIETSVKIEPGVGNWAGAAKRFTLKMPDGREFGAGTRGSYALNAERLKLQLNEKSEATVRYFQLTPDGIPRFGVVLDIHIDGRKD